MSLLKRLKRRDWILITCITIVLAVLLIPAPHWRQTVSQSCHLCGNRRVVIEEYRWWHLHERTIEPVVGAEYPVEDNHRHEWWQYGSSFNSGAVKWASSNSSRYRDGYISDD